MYLSTSLTLSGKRDSNSRPQPWQGCALPTELFPHYVSLPRLVSFLFLGQGCALPTELFPHYVILAKVGILFILGARRALPTELFPHYVSLPRLVSFLFLGQGCALPTELFPHYVILAKVGNHYLLGQGVLYQLSILISQSIEQIAKFRCAHDKNRTCTSLNTRT